MRDRARHHSDVHGRAHQGRISPENACKARLHRVLYARPQSRRRSPTGHPQGRCRDAGARHRGHVADDQDSRFLRLCRTGAHGLDRGGARQHRDGDHVLQIPPSRPFVAGCPQGRSASPRALRLRPRPATLVRLLHRSSASSGCGTRTPRSSCGLRTKGVRHEPRSRTRRRRHFPRTRIGREYARHVGRRRSRLGRHPGRGLRPTKPVGRRQASGLLAVGRQSG